jgi:hypothetical protein
MSTTDTAAMRPLLFPDHLQFWYETASPTSSSSASRRN